MLQFVLFLHVIAAIVAFGPTYALPIIGSMGGQERQHANFGVRASLAITKRRILPFALSMPVTGVALIWLGNIDLLSNRWLLVAIVLYVVAIGWSLGVQVPTVERIVALTSAPMPAPGPGAAPAGPPPELAAAIRRVQQGGILLATLVALIAALMVTKPF